MQLLLVDAGDLKAVSRKLRYHGDGKRLRKELVAEMKEAGEPLARNVRAAWLSAPSKGAPKSRSRRSRGDLRQLLADATWVQARLTGKEAGVRIRSDGRKMPDQMKALPGYAEGIRRRPWRHPVGGDRETWVSQARFPRFYEAARPDELAARRKCLAAVDKVFDEIERAR